jgi:hypothetical protein
LTFCAQEAFEDKKFDAIYLACGFVNGAKVILLAEKRKQITTQESSICLILFSSKAIKSL